MVWIEPLDLQSILVNTLAGSYDIFVGLAAVFIAGLCAYFRMQNEITLLIFAIFFIMMSGFIGSGYMLIIIIIGALLTYFSIAKIMK